MKNAIVCRIVREKEQTGRPTMLAFPDFDQGKYIYRKASVNLVKRSHNRAARRSKEMTKQQAERVSMLNHCRRVADHRRTL